MMAYSVPPVTLEDLRTFQARHFIVREGELHQSYQTESWEEQQFYDDDDDGLGYYTDGVKRTLTDEQIEIFRHSEIQRLLHERRLKARAEEDKNEPERKKTNDQDAAMADANASVSAEMSNKNLQRDTVEDDANSRGHARESSTQLNEKFPSHNGHATYEDDEQAAKKRPPPYSNVNTAQAPFSRRIITYDD
ncbi:hypothetical protein VTO42DRAFT_814 [Malbranchea cinnamomea]